MLLITITEWKRKCGIILRLVVFLILIGLIIPQFLNFIAAQISSYRVRPEGGTPPGLRVEGDALDTLKEPTSGQLDEAFLIRLREFYHGREN